MAFCPECGKAVTADEAVCTGCGKQLRSTEKKARGGRFHGTMMMTAPEVKPEPPANLNAQRLNEQAKAVASAAGVTSPRLGVLAAQRSSRPPSAQHAGNAGAPTLGRAAPAHLKATMIGAAPVGEPQKPQKPQPKHATMVGAALAPTTPRSKPPAPAGASSSRPAPAQPTAQSERPPVVRQTSPQASNNASVRAVQSMPVSAADDDTVQQQSQPAATAPVYHDAQTVPSPVPPRDAERRSPNPARMVQAIPEVDATVVDPHELQRLPRESHGSFSAPYLPGDPMAPQPPAAKRAPRLREHPFAPEQPEVEGAGNYVLLYWAVCVAFVAAACALAFRLF